MYDLIVIGAGAVGSATAWAAAGHGLRVLLLEQFAVDHQRGSSHGASRIIRYAYDHVQYVELAQAAFGLWRELEMEANERFYLRCGGIDFAPPASESFAATCRALQATGIPHELLNATEAAYRFTQFRFGAELQVLYQPDAGALRASAAVRALVRLAQSRGATLREHAGVSRIEVHGEAVTVTAGGQRYQGAKLVLAAGAWMNHLLRPLGLELPLQVIAAQENYYSASPPEQFLPERFPVWIAHVQARHGQIVYGLPDIDGSGIKIALHHGRPIEPDAAERDPDNAVIAAMTEFARQTLPAVAAHRSSRACLYTLTPDGHFIIDRHPQHAHVVIASCCSGHAFKFCPELGRRIASLVMDGPAAQIPDLFRLAAQRRRW